MKKIPTQPHRCKKCGKKTPHTEHGFRNHNYRLVCTICNEINYYESDMY